MQKLFSKKEPTLMGIVNITEDSFSDGGKYVEARRAIKKSRELIKDGADILDLGAEATGPGSKPISEEQEIERLKKVVSQISKESIISIDTFKAETARACLELGAKVINDVSALRYDGEMAKVIAEFKAYAVIMYSKESGKQPHVSDSKKEYQNLVKEISDFLSKRVEFALANGVETNKIILDPGMGKFISHDDKYSWELLEEFQQLKDNFREFTLLIGTSRKGFLGGKLEQRDRISVETALDAHKKGAQIIRTHDVALTKMIFNSICVG